MVERGVSNLVLGPEDRLERVSSESESGRRQKVWLLRAITLKLLTRQVNVLPSWVDLSIVRFSMNPLKLPFGFGNLGNVVLSP